MNASATPALVADDVLTAHTRWATTRGLYTPGLHQGQHRPPQPVGLSETSDADLSDHFAAWTSETQRLLELEAAVAGRRAQLVLAVRRCKAEAGVEIRVTRQKVSATELADLVCLDPAVRESEDALADLDVVGAFASRQRQAAECQMTLISREISHRIAAKNARLL